MKYATTVTCTLPDRRALTEDELTQPLDLRASMTLTDDAGQADVTFTIVEASSPTAAADRAIDRVRQVLGDIEVDALEILTTAERDRQLALPPFPELVGVTEIAEMFGVSRKRASRLQSRSDFPLPVANLAAGPVWRKGDLSGFAEAWKRGHATVGILLPTTPLEAPVSPFNSHGAHWDGIIRPGIWSHGHSSRAALNDEVASTHARHGHVQVRSQSEQRRRRQLELLDVSSLHGD